MKKVKMMYLKTCPHCRKAFQMVEELKEKYPELQRVEIETIEENDEAEKIEGYDYWYVPTYFVDDVKLLEGIPTIEQVEAVLRAAVQ